LSWIVPVGTVGKIKEIQVFEKWNGVFPFRGVRRCADTPW
jgi:hypothetical protein